MRALSIRQPWAWLIVSGYKDIENRTWATRFRGRVYVHAGKLTLPLEAFPAQRDYLRRAGIVLPPDLPRGALVGEVTITGCVEHSVNPWFCGPYGFVLAEPVIYPVPVPCRGRLGFFRVDDCPANRLNGKLNALTDRREEEPQCSTRRRNPGQSRCCPCARP